MQNTMLEGQGCCQVLLLFLFTGFGSVNGPVLPHRPDLKLGCLGDSIAMFENIVLKNDVTHVSVYKTSYIQGAWNMRNGTLVRNDGMNNRIVLDHAGNIWINNLSISDEANYTIQVGIGQPSNKYNIALKVIAPTTQNCKPNITYDGTKLIAELNIDECGRPAASVKWFHNSGTEIWNCKANIKYKGEMLIAELNNDECDRPPALTEMSQHSGPAILKNKIQAGNNNDIYIACTDGDSLACAKINNGIEYCSFYQNNNSPCKSCETSTSSTYTDIVIRTDTVLMVIQTIMTVPTFIMVPICLILLITIMKKISNQTCTNGHLVNHRNQTQETDVDNMSNKGVTQPLLPVNEASCPTGSHDAHQYYDKGHQSTSQPPIQELSTLPRASIKKRADKVLPPREHD